MHFAAFKKHIGIFPGGEATAVFADRLTEYKTTRGAIQLPLDKPMPYDLISDIARWRVVLVENQKKQKQSARKPTGKQATRQT